MNAQPDPAAIRASVETVIKQMMDRIMMRVLQDDPFDVDKHRALKPLYAALVPDEIFKGSHFERRFVTAFGSAWEKLAAAVGQAAHGHSAINYSVQGFVPVERLQRISETLNRLEHAEHGAGRIRPDWNSEMTYIIAGGGEPLPVTVICDVYIENAMTNERIAVELKSPLPNSDVTKVSKEKIMKLYAMEPRLITDAYFALPYNPFGTKMAYDWGFPSRWFDMQRDAIVLIGDEVWDRIGGAGTYTLFIETINALGSMYQARIYRDYLGIEPPHIPDDSA